MAQVKVIDRDAASTVISAGADGQQVTIPHLLPIMPIRNIVIFPGAVSSLNVGRRKSKNLLEVVMPGEKLIGVITQRSGEVEEPSQGDLHAVGVVCSILKLYKLPDGNQSIIVSGLARFKIDSVTQEDPYLLGQVTVLEDLLLPTSDGGVSTAELDALIASVRQQANRVIELSPNTPDEAAQMLATIQSPGALSDILAANLHADANDKQALLEELNVVKRLRMVGGKLATHLDVLELQNKIQSQVKENIDKSQRRYYLQEQLRAIRKELGEGESGGESEVESLRQKLTAAQPSEIVMKEAARELARLESIPPASPEYGVIRTYLQILSELPWATLSDDKFDLVEARNILDRDHFDLDKVKRRIIEYLAVRKLISLRTTPSTEAGAILCFVGPPGVGKTSLGKSIAEAMGRKFIRVALGGVRDEADIRGHRRTYIGAMPGRIIAELRKAGTRNPVMMLDEIDKLGNDFRGDPSAALLEVLDPAQNHTFTDHYLDVPFDLSKVLFIATSNSMDPVPGPLRDRMEVIEIPGYTDADKLAIALKYLAPRQLDANGLSVEQAHFKDDALQLIIESYTREAGVRSLERNIGSVARAIAAEIVQSWPVETATTPSDGPAPASRPALIVDKKYVSKALGAVRFEPELASRTSVPGVATGLAYTPVGGEILFIEASSFSGKGNITLTGQIGDVMKESATAAFTLIRSRSKDLGIAAHLLSECDFHIHVPAGAVPKDGPSAGVAMFTALASLLTRRPVKHDVAMTGEITLRGLVLPIGGLKEKVLAAARAGIREVIIPKRNEKDMSDIPPEIRKSLKFHLVNDVTEVLKHALGVRLAGEEGKRKAKPRKMTKSTRK